MGPLHQVFRFQDVPLAAELGCRLKHPRFTAEEVVLAGTHRGHCEAPARSGASLQENSALAPPTTSSSAALRQPQISANNPQNTR